MLPTVAQPLAIPPPGQAVRNVYIARLPSENFGDTELQTMCSPYGIIISARIMRSKGSGSSKGYAFVLFDTEDSAKRCVEGVHGRVIDGTTQPLEARFAHNEASDPTKLAHALGSGGARSSPGSSMSSATALSPNSSLGSATYSGSRSGGGAINLMTPMLNTGVGIAGVAPGGSPGTSAILCSQPQPVVMLPSGQGIQIAPQQPQPQPVVMPTNAAIVLPNGQVVSPTTSPGNSGSSTQTQIISLMPGTAARPLVQPNPQMVSVGGIPMNVAGVQSVQTASPPMVLQQQQQQPR